MPLHGANRQRPTNRKGVDMNKVSGIYRIDLGNGYFYIGSTTNLNKRKREHQYNLLRCAYINHKMQSCWNKYQVFEFTVLQYCNKEELLICEQHFLDKHFDNKKNVNITPTAGSTLGVVHSAETRAKISAIHKGRVLSVEHRAKISAANKGRVFSIEHREKMSASRIGRVLSDEARAKLSAANKGKSLSDETRAKISATTKGVPKSAETRLKMSKAQRRRRHAG